MKDTACARQQVMLRAKYSNDIKSERKRQSGKEGQTEEKRKGLVSLCLLAALTILSWNIDV